jgi:amino acid permease
MVAFSVAFSILLTILFFIVGGIVGYLGHLYLQYNTPNYSSHPEIFDDEGKVMAGDLLTVTFEGTEFLEDSDFGDEEDDE